MPAVSAWVEPPGLPVYIYSLAEVRFAGPPSAAALHEVGRSGRGEARVGQWVKSVWTR